MDDRALPPSFLALLDAISTREISGIVHATLVLADLSRLLSQTLHQYAARPAFALATDAQEVPNRVRIPGIVLRTIGITLRNNRSCRHADKLRR